MTKHQVGEDENVNAPRTNVAAAERNLWARVLEMAIRDGVRGDSKMREWFFCDDTSDYSFLWICQVLNFSPTPIRQEVAKRNVELLKKL